MRPAGAARGAAAAAAAPPGPGTAGDSSGAGGGELFPSGLGSPPAGGGWWPGTGFLPFFGKEIEAVAVCCPKAGEGSRTREERDLEWVGFFEAAGGTGMQRRVRIVAVFLFNVFSVLVNCTTFLKE